MVVTPQTQRVQTLEQVRRVAEGNEPVEFAFVERASAYEALRVDSCEATAQLHRPAQSPLSGSNPQLNSGRPPSAPTTTTSSSHARSRSPPG